METDTHPQRPGASPPQAGWPRLAAGVVRARWAILAAVLAGSLLLARPALQLRPIWNEQAELRSDDPEMAYFRRFLERYGGHEYLLVVLETDGVFTPDMLAHIAELTEALRETPHAADVASLSTLVTVRGDGGDARIEPLFAELPATAAEAGRIRDEAMAHPLGPGTLVSADSRTAGINVMLPPVSEDATARIEAVEGVRAILDRHARPDVRVSITGLSPLAADVLATLGRDARRLLWLTPLVILLFFGLAFRSPRNVAAASAFVFVAVLWAIGLLALGGGSLNIATVMLPTIVAVNGLSYVIHLLNACRERAARGSTAPVALSHALAHMIPALLMAGLTTAVGFGTQMTADLRSLRELGLFSSLGILMAVLLCVTLVPSLLSRRLPRPRPARGRRRLRRFLWAVGSFANRDRRVIPAALLVLLAAAAVGIARIRIEALWSRHLPERAPSIQGLRVVERELAGFYILEVELKGEPGTFREPWAIEEIGRLQRYAAGLPGVDRVFSVRDLLQAAHRARADDAGETDNEVTLTRGQIAEYLLLFSIGRQREAVDSLLTDDRGAARVALRIRTMTSADQLRLVKAVEDYATTGLDPRLRLRTTGVVKLVALNIEAIVRGFIRSFGLSLVLIAALMSVQLRSLRVGLVSMIPNVLPIVLGFGLMGLLGMPLSASTVMIASVGIGIAVDDTIHFLHRFRREIRAGHSPERAVQRTLLGAGRAMVYAALALAAGFAVLVGSEFRLNREFGFLTAFIMLAALGSDLFVTPWLARVLGLFRKESPR